MTPSWRPRWLGSGETKLGFGGILAILLVGVAFLAAGAIGLAWLGERQFEAPALHLPPPVSARIASIVTLVAEAPDARMLTQIGRATSGRDFRLQIVPVPPPGVREAAPPWLGPEAPLAAQLLERLPGHVVRVRPLRRLDSEEGGRRRPSLEIVVDARPDRWLILRLGPEAFGPAPIWRLLATIGVVLGIVIVVALVLASRLAAPVRSLARAADRLGSDLGAPPLPETGPRELRAAARAFNRMQERLRGYIEDRTRMLAAISHDLRTALTRLRLRVELIDDDEVRSRTERDLDEMQQMLEATLTFARDDAAREPRGEIDLAALLRSACADFAEVGAAAVYVGPETLAIPLRPLAMRRLIDNLVDNAVKYGGQADVELVRTAQGVEIRVGDRGPGIPPEHRERVFEPFYRVEGSRSRETGGSGLGLAVARSVARAHGGDISLSDRPGGGMLAVAALPGKTA